MAYSTPYNITDAVNKVLKDARVIQGDAGELTSLTDTARQPDIDAALAAWNEITHELYTLGLFTGEAAEGSIVLSTSTTTVTASGAGTYPGLREYSLATDFERFAGEGDTAVLIDATNTQTMLPYDGGYMAMRRDQVTATDFTGLPHRYTINPVTGYLRVDADPTSSYAGRTYTYIYDKRLVFTGTATSDTFPYSDTVVDALTPAVKELFSRKREGEFDSGLFKLAYNRAVSYLTQSQPRTRYGKRWPK